MVVSIKDLNEYKGSYYSKEIDATYQISIKKGILTLKRPNKTPVNLEISNKDVFIFNRLLIRFTRIKGNVSGLKVDAGRVKNLKFDKN